MLNQRGGRISQIWDDKSGDKELFHLLELNLRWMMTEVIHSVNNSLGSIQYAVYDLQNSGSQEEALEVVDRTVNQIAGALRGTFDLLNPLLDPGGFLPLKGLCEKVYQLIERRVRSQGIGFSIEIPELPQVERRSVLPVSQFLFTFLWLRLEGIEKPGWIRLCSKTSDATQSLLCITDSCSAKFEPMLLPKDAEPVVRHPWALDRKGFARYCLAAMARYFPESAKPHYDKQGAFCFGAQLLQEEEIKP